MVYRWLHSTNKELQQWYQNRTHVYHNCNSSQIFTFGGYVKVRESLYTQVITWVNTILNHIDIREILAKYESSLHGV